MKAKLILLTAALGLAGIPKGHAAILDDFGGNDGIFDKKTSVSVDFTDPDSGLLVTMTVLGIGGELNSNAGDFGIGDDLIDGTEESIQLTFSRDIELISVDLGGVGSDTTDGANLSIGPSFTIDLHTGVDNFNGTQDIYTPTSPIALASGDAITLTGSSATSSFDLETINLHVVPEPSVFGLVMISGLAAVAILRRRRT